MLKFIGTGSAFNTKLGNNSAYIKEGKHLFLIDCGSANFHRMSESGFLDDVEYINVFITHTHPDHVGSLGDLIFHMYYTKGMKNRVDVYEVEGTGVKELLELNGIKEELYTLFQAEVEESFEVLAPNIAFFPFETKHDKNLKSYGLGIIDMNNGETVIYTGDTYELPYGTEDVLMNDEVDRVYIDTCSQDYEGNVHLSLKKLTEATPVEQRHKVWCMHLDKNFDVEYAKSLGFNVVKSEEIFNV